MKTIEELKADGYIDTITNTLYIASCDNATDEAVKERIKVIPTFTDEQLILIDALFLNYNQIDYDVYKIIDEHRDIFNELWKLN